MSISQIGSTPVLAIYFREIKMKPTLTNVLGTEKAELLEKTLLGKADVLSKKDISSEEATLKYLRANLRSSYIFNRFVVPSYMSHVFSSLKDFPPLDDNVGYVVRQLLGMCKGELTNNNVYNRRGECHSHFRDLYEAYAEAGGDTKEFDAFEKLVEEFEIFQGMAYSEKLWSEKAKTNASVTLSRCTQPLECFVLMACNEILTTVIFPVVIEKMSKHSRFDKFRKFMEVHIDLDGDDHSCATLDWIAIYLENNKFTKREINNTVDRVLDVFVDDRLV